MPSKAIGASVAAGASTTGASVAAGASTTGASVAGVPQAVRSMLVKTNMDNSTYTARFMFLLLKRNENEGVNQQCEDIRASTCIQSLNAF
jgi:hypothetical protein